jgi:hypothetical protein
MFFHRITLIVTCQSLFGEGKYRVTMTRQASYIVTFYNKINKTQITILSKRIHGQHANFLQEAFDFIFQISGRNDLKYVLLDSNPISNWPHYLVAVTNIFPSEVDNVIRPIFFFSDTQKNKK